MIEQLKEKIKAYYVGDDIDKILDCITDLQQLYENGLKVNQNENKYRTELEEKYYDLQQENKRLKEDNLLIKSGNKLVSDKLQDYKSRCKKASNKLDSMFANGEENKILDDLLELDKIVKGDK